MLTEDLDFIKKEHPKEYWQIISNGEINKVPKGEAIVYMPYEREIEELRELMQDEDYLQQVDLTIKDMYYIHEKPICDLPVLPDDSLFSNLNIFEFEIPKEDIEFLTSRVIMAENLIKHATK